MDDFAPSAAAPRAAPAVAPAPRNARRPFLVLFAIVLVAGLAVGGYLVLTAGEVTTDDAQVEADVVPIAPRTSGAVQQVQVRENQRVKRGDLLLELDPANERVHVAQAEADLAVARAQADAAEAQVLVVEATATGGLHSAKAQVSSSVVDVASAEARVDVATAALERARADARKANLDLERSKALRAGQAVAQEQLDSVSAAADAAHAALTQAEASLVAAQDSRRAAVSHVAEAQGKLAASAPIEATISGARAQAVLARAKIDSLAAALDLAKLQLSYTRVTAPQDGVVSKLAVHEGQLVATGQAIAELVPDATYVVANFKETQIADLRPGARAKVELDAFPGHSLDAEVESLAGGTGARFSLMPADNASGNFVKVVQRVPVRLRFVQPPPWTLRAGLSATVTAYTRGH